MAEKDALGCRVVHDITRPDLFSIMHEVGGNINQKGYRHIGGGLILCEKGQAPQRRVIKNY